LVWINDVRIPDSWMHVGSFLMVVPRSIAEYLQDYNYATHLPEYPSPSVAITCPDRLRSRFLCPGSRQLGRQSRGSNGCVLPNPEPNRAAIKKRRPFPNYGIGAKIASCDLSP